MLIRSADIGDQSRKLSEIAPNFGLFSRSQILGADLPKIVPMHYHPWHAARLLEKFREPRSIGQAHAEF